MRKIYLIAIASLVLVMFFAAPVFAADWGVGMDNNGNVTWGVGSDGSNSGSNAGSNFGNNYGNAAPGSFFSSGTVGSFGLPGGSILGILQRGLIWLLAIFGTLGIIAFVISGIMYLTAAGDEKQIEKAKRVMTTGIIGIIVGLSGFIAIQAVNAWLSGGSTSF